MPTRTNKLIGKIWGDPANPAILTVNYNGQQVFSGPAPTVSGTYDPTIPEDQLDVLATWQDDSSTAGNIPVTISVTGGTLHFLHILMNEITSQVELSLKENPVWPGYAPSSLEELMNDRGTLSDEEFQAKYSAPKSFTYDVTDVTVITPIESYFRLPTVINSQTDGKNSVFVDGVDVTRSVPLTSLGSWGYRVGDGSTLTYTQIVDPRVVPNL